MLALPRQGEGLPHLHDDQERQAPLRRDPPRQAEGQAAIAPRAQCSVCWHVLRKDLDKFLREDKGYAPILRYLLREAELHPDKGIKTYTTKYALKGHREKCLALPALEARGGAQPRTEVGDPTQAPADVTAEEIGRRARIKLASKLDSLSPKELHQLSVESMRLERARIAAKIKSGDDDDGEGNDAAAGAELDRAIERTALRAV